MKELEKIILELGEMAHQSHFWVDDNWYSCPKAPDGCSNDATVTECNCGADEHNAKVDKLVKNALKLNEWSSALEEIFNKAAFVDGKRLLSHPNILKK